MRVCITVLQCNVTMETTSDNDLVLTLVDAGNISYQYTWLRVVAEPRELVFGGGEQFTHFNLRERTYGSPEVVSVLRADDLKYPIWTREQGKIVLVASEVNRVANFL